MSVADPAVEADDTLAARVRQLEDRRELGDLVARYCIAVDDRDLDTLIPLFTSDARMGHADGSAGGTGEASIRRYYEERLSGVATCFHYPHAQLVDFVDDDTATGVVLAHAEMAVDDQMVIAAIRYHDSYLREGGAWRFRERRLRFFYLMDVTELPTSIHGRDRKRWPGPPEPADLPDSLETYRSFRARVG